MPYPSEVRKRSRGFNGINIDIVMPDLVLPTRDYTTASLTAEAFLELQNQRDAAIILRENAQKQLHNALVELEAIRKRVFKGPGEIPPPAVTDVERGIEHLQDELHAKHTAPKAELDLHDCGSELEKVKRELVREGKRPIYNALDGKTWFELTAQLFLERKRRETVEMDLQKRIAEVEELRARRGTRRSPGITPLVGLESTKPVRGPCSSGFPEEIL